MMESLAGVRARILQATGSLSEYSSTSVLLVVGVVTLIVGAMSYLLHRNQAANLPPGPRNWPIIGSLLQMGPSFYKTLNGFSAKYGPIMYFRLGVQNFVVVSSAETAEELLRHRDAEFSDRETPMNRSTTRYVGLDGVAFPFANYDAEYKLLRKLVSTEFLATPSIKTFEKLRTQEVLVMVESIFSEIQSKASDNEGNRDSAGTTPINIRLTVLAAVRNILFALSVGNRFDSLSPTDELREFPDILDNVMELVLSFNLVDFFPRLTWLDPQGLMKTLKKFDRRQRSFYKTIFERSRRELKSKPESAVSNDTDVQRTSFMQLLLQAREKGALNITDDGVIVTVREMLSGGIDTSGTEISWAMVELVRHPKILRRLQDEVDGVVGKERPLEEADMRSMPFLNAVMLETLRLHPIIPHTFPHVNMKPSTLCGYDIPANTAVLLNMWSLGRDPTRFKDPLEFNPDRFLSDAPGSETIRANGSCYHLLPFSSGRRMCPGYNLAVVLVSRLVATLVHAFDWSPPEGCSPEDVSIETAGVFLLRPDSPIIVPTPRLAPHVYKSNIGSNMA